MRQLINLIFVLALSVSSFSFATSIPVAPAPSDTVSFPMDTASKITIPIIMMLPVGFDVISAYFSDSSRKDAETSGRDSKIAWLSSEILGSLGALAGFASVSTFVYNVATSSPSRLVFDASWIAAGAATLINLGNGVSTSIATHAEDVVSYKNQLAIGFAWAALLTQSLILKAF